MKQRYFSHKKLKTRLINCTSLQTFEYLQNKSTMKITFMMHLFKKVFTKLLVGRFKYIYQLTTIKYYKTKILKCHDFDLNQFI